MVQLLTVDPEFAGQRLDNFLFARFSGVPTGLFYRLLRRGAIRVNRHRVQPKYKLLVDDQITLPQLTVRAVEKRAQPSASQIKQLLNRVIFEDQQMIVLNKPAGMAVHGGSGIAFGVIETLRAAQANYNKLELVHRLDRDTSGCLVLAKKHSTLRELQALMRAGAWRKFYVLLVKGHLVQDPQIVSKPLKKMTTKSGERVVIVAPDGKPSETIFRTRQNFEELSYLEAELKTGRTHQIRVHTAAIGHHIAGDPKYGDEELNAKLRAHGLKRMFLHAEQVDFMWRGTKRHFKAPLEQELEISLKHLVIKKVP